MKWIKSTTGDFPKEENEYSLREPKTGGGYRYFGLHIVPHAINKDSWVESEWEWLDESPLLPTLQGRAEAVAFAIWTHQQGYVPDIIDGTDKWSWKGCLPGQGITSADLYQLFPGKGDEDIKGQNMAIKMNEASKWFNELTVDERQHLRWIYGTPGEGYLTEGKILQLYGMSPPALERGWTGKGDKPVGESVKITKEGQCDHEWVSYKTCCYCGANDSWMGKIIPYGDHPQWPVKELSRKFEEWYFSIVGDIGKPPLAMQIFYWFAKHLNLFEHLATAPAPSVAGEKMVRALNEIANLPNYNAENAALDTCRIIAREALSTPQVQGDWVNTQDKPLFKTTGMGWQMNEGVPTEFIAAIEVRNNKTGEKYWWIRHCVVQDGTGLHVVTDDDTEPCGWNLSDVMYYRPLPEPPYELSTSPLKP